MTELQFWSVLLLICSIVGAFSIYRLTTLEHTEDQKNTAELKKDLKETNSNAEALNRNTKVIKESLKTLHDKVDEEKEQDKNPQIYYKEISFYIVENPNEHPDNHTLSLVLKVVNKNTRRHEVIEGIYFSGNVKWTSNKPHRIPPQIPEDYKGPLQAEHIWNIKDSKIIGKYTAISGEEKTIKSLLHINFNYLPEHWGTKDEYQLKLEIKGNINIIFHETHPDLINNVNTTTIKRLSKMEWATIN